MISEESFNNHILLLCLCYLHDPKNFTQYNTQQLDEIAFSLRMDEDWSKICHFVFFQDNEITSNDDALPTVLQKIKQLFNISKKDTLTNTIDFLVAEENKSANEPVTIIPPTLATLIVKLMQPQKNESIYDPTCRSGDLLSAFSNIENLKTFGQEPTLDRWITAQLTIMLNGKTPHGIKHSDCLLQPLQQHDQLEKFDIVVASPPWGKSGKDVKFENDLKRFKWGMPSSRLDYAYISHMVASMRPENGRMAVLMQHGVLFRSAMEATIRQKLIEDNLLDTVVALPEKLLPLMSSPVVLLIFKKQRPDTSVLWIDASQNYVADKYQNKLSQQHVNHIISLYLKRQSVPQQANLASFATIKENQFKLNIPLYIQPKHNTAPNDLKAMQQKRQQLIDQWEKLQQELDSLLITSS